MQDDYGFLPQYWVTTWAWAKMMNARYDWTSIKPTQAAEMVKAAKEGQALPNLILTTRANAAPRDYTGALLKAAYLTAWSSRYLQNPALASIAEGWLRKAKKSKNSRRASKITKVYRQAGNTIRAMAGGRASDGQIKRVLYLLGVQPGGAQSGGGYRQLTPEIKSAQDQQLDPTAEANRAALEVIEAPGKYGKKAYDAALRRMRRLKRKAAQLRRKQLQIQLAAGAGVFALVLVLVAAKATKK